MSILETILGQLSQSVILSEGDVMKLREYIAIKHAQKTVTERALILADALNRVVEPAFEGIDFEHWVPLRKNLFQNTLAIGVLTLHKGHIFEAVLTLQESAEQLKYVLAGWLTKHIETPIQSSDLENYFPKNHKADIAQEVEITCETRFTPETILAELPHLSEADHYYNKESVSKLEQTYSQKELQVILKNLGWVACGLQFIVSQFIWQPQLLSPIEVSPIEPINVMKVANTDQAVYKELVSGKKPAAVKSSVPMVTAVSEVISVPTVSKVSANPVAKPVKHIATPKSTASVNVNHKKPFAYKHFNESELKRALNSRNSILAEDKYFNTIMQTAKAHSLDPRLLFAIAGQEQSLVKKTLPHAARVANNPFNIYGSWKKYNTSISDSSDIVCNTIVNRMKKWNGSGSALKWINRTYADDPHWHVGVKRYYDWLIDETN